MSTADRYLRSRLILATITVALVASFSSQVFCKGSFTVKPAPAWTITAATTEQKSGGSSDKESGIQTILQDTQIRVSGNVTERYYRVIKKVISSAKLEEVSQLKLDFEPTFQELIIHEIHIIRNGQTIDALRPREIKVVQRENELSQQVYNGTLSALVFLNDVRQGDVIDYSYSVNGENPVLRGLYADFYYLADSDPVDRIRFRLLWPTSRVLKTVNKNTDTQPATRVIGDQQEYIWDVTNTPGIDYEDSLPSWFNPFPRVQVSEFGTWNDVIRWALPLYNVKDAPSGALAHQIDTFRERSQNPEDRLIEALRFVQDEVRYLGIELGPNSHQPTQPSVVFDRRFGDCKDKSLLLATILNGLNIEAHPALVNTETKSELGNLQPNPFAFNHCIVQAKLDGKTYWLDPTIGLQRGTLKRYYAPNYAMALVLSEGSHDLEKIPDQATNDPTIIVKEKFHRNQSNGRIELDVVTTYSGSDADDMRSQLKENSVSELGRDYLNYYAESFPSIESTEPLNISDDPYDNIISVTEKYEILEFWKNGQRSIVADRIDTELRKPTISKRAWPLGVKYPVSIEQTLEFDMPVSIEALAVPLTTIKMETDAFRLEYGVDEAADHTSFHYRFQTLTDSVPATKVSKHLANLEQARNAIWYDLREGGTVGTVAIRPKAGGSVFWIPISILGLILGPLVLIGGYRAAKANRRRNQFKDKLDLAHGDAASTAIPIQKESDLFTYLADYKCMCGTDYRHPGSIEREALLYDGRRLIVVQLKCISCGRSRDVYFAPEVIM